MQEFQILDEKRYPIVPKNFFSKTDLLPYHRFEHRVTIGYNGRTFMVLLDNLQFSAYVEEITTNLEQIKDTNLWQSLINFAVEKGFLIVIPPIMKEKKQWI